MRTHQVALLRQVMLRHVLHHGVGLDRGGLGNGTAFGRRESGLGLREIAGGSGRECGRYVAMYSGNARSSRPGGGWRRTRRGVWGGGCGCNGGSSFWGAGSGPAWAPRGAIIPSFIVREVSARWPLLAPCLPAALVHPILHGRSPPSPAHPPWCLRARPPFSALGRAGPSPASRTSG